MPTLIRSVLRVAVDAALVDTGPHAYRRKNGIAVVPAALLGP
jgi:hypothetical protein